MFSRHFLNPFDVSLMDIMDDIGDVNVSDCFLFLGNTFFEDWLILNLRGLLCLEVVHRRISLGYQPLEVISGV